MTDQDALAEAAGLLIQHGYCVIHQDRIQLISVEKAVSAYTLKNMKPEFTNAFHAHLSSQGVHEIGRYMWDAGLIHETRGALLDESGDSYRYRWGTCVVLPFRGRNAEAQDQA